MIQNFLVFFAHFYTLVNLSQLFYNIVIDAAAFRETLRSAIERWQTLAADFCESLFNFIFNSEFDLDSEFKLKSF